MDAESDRSDDYRIIQKAAKSKGREKESNNVKRRKSQLRKHRTCPQKWFQDKSDC